jgi:hypothetical protein
MFATGNKAPLGLLVRKVGADGKEKDDGGSVSPENAAVMDQLTAAGGRCWIACMVVMSEAAQRKAAQVTLDGTGAPDLDGRAGRADAVAGPHDLICPRDAGEEGGENENENEAELVHGEAPWEKCTAISRIRSMRGAIVTITTAVAPMLIGAARFGNGCHHPKSVSMGR